jgi:glycosyltransferase involved in cell wall biosynthesis
MKIIICTNTAWNLVNFREGLIRALIGQGHEVVAVAPYDEYANKLTGFGCRFIPLSMNNKGTNPVRDLLLFFRFVRMLQCERPDVFLGFTVKPNIYGSLAAQMLNIPVVNNIAGLGSVFINDGWLARLVRGLYQITLSRSTKVFFQNNDDRTKFINSNTVLAEVADLLPGSGVDLTRFTCDAGESSLLLTSSNNRGKFRFLLIARMLWEKGVGEYVEAAKLIKASHLDVEFCLLGFLDVKNPSAITRAEMDNLVSQGVVYLGASDDVRLEIQIADCIVLPSYYAEGTPKTLLEAAAMRKPIITSDAAGCRDVVDDGMNGYLCKVRDVGDLAKKMKSMIELSESERRNMGIAGRRKMEREFDEKIVIDKYTKTLNAILQINSITPKREVQ